MCYKTENLPVLTLSDFSTQHLGFVMMPIENVHHHHSIIEAAHKQAYYTILFCQQGKGTVVVDKQQIAIQDNSVICIGPNSVSSFDIQSITNGWMILFSDAFFSMRYNDNVLYNFTCLKYNNLCQQTLEQNDATEWQFYMQLMHRELQQNAHDAQSVLRSYMNIILSILNRNNTAIQKNKELKSIKDKKITAFEKLIEVYYKKEKLPSFYSREMYITSNYLNRICQEKRGLSSGDMIRKRVIIEAERLLYHTYNSISEIAIELGFESTSYFTTFFKKYTGYTPDAFRKLNK